jgi:hypothetical protein
MALLRKFIRLSPADRALFLEAFALLLQLRLMMWLLPFPTMKRIVARMQRVNPSAEEADWTRIRQIVEPVKVMSRFVPRATCLTQALAAQILLARRGHSSNLKIGVLRNGSGQIDAHAWVQIQERVLIGNRHDLSQFVLLPSLSVEEW